MKEQEQPDEVNVPLVVEDPQIPPPPDFTRDPPSRGDGQVESVLLLPGRAIELILWIIYSIFLFPVACVCRMVEKRFKKRGQFAVLAIFAVGLLLSIYVLLVGSLFYDTGDFWNSVLLVTSAYCISTAITGVGVFIRTYTLWYCKKRAARRYAVQV